MDVQLKQRLVGLTVIFSLAVIFLPMLLDGAGISRDQVTDQPFPVEPEIAAGVNVEELVLELDKKTKKLVQLEPVIVDEISDPPRAEPTKPAVELTQPQDKAEQKPDTQKTQQKAAVVESVSEPKVSVQAEPVVDKKPSALQNAPKPQPVEVKTEKPADDQPDTPDPRAGGQLWVVQTGSFQEKDKAYKQRDDIRKSKLGAVFIEKYQHQGQLRYRVRIGPFLTRDKANVVRNKLRAKHNIRSILMKYEK
jgi:DedD protein